MLIAVNFDVGDDGSGDVFALLRWPIATQPAHAYQWLYDNQYSWPNLPCNGSVYGSNDDRC